MNVNTVPSSESTKLTKSSSQTEIAADEPQSHEGFFAKLMAFVSGESSPKADAPSNIDGNAAATSAESATAEGEPAPEVIAQGDESEQALLAGAVADDETPEPESAEQILSQGDELLGRLTQANQALQSKRGKSLPPEALEKLEVADNAKTSADISPLMAGEKGKHQPAANTLMADGQVVNQDSGESDALNRQSPLSDTAQSDSMASAEPKVTSDIVWGASTQIKHEQQAALGKEVSLGASGHSPAQGVNPALTQGVTPALNSASQPTTAAELNAAPLPVGGQADKAIVAAEGDALKAALGKSLVANLAKNGQTEKLGESSLTKDDSFANQLAHAAGQVGQNQALTPQARAEQAGAQPPLLLQRDIAGDQLAERVQMMLSKNLKNIDIRLDPPELGRLHIRMNMSGDGASVQFTVASPQAREMIEHSMPRLREMLSQQGVQLSDTSVQQQSAGQQQSSYAQRGEDNRGDSMANSSAANTENLEANVKVDVNVATKRDGISYYA